MRFQPTLPQDVRLETPGNETWENQMLQVFGSNKWTIIPIYGALFSQLNLQLSIINQFFTFHLLRYTLLVLSDKEPETSQFGLKTSQNSTCCSYLGWCPGENHPWKMLPRIFYKSLLFGTNWKNMNEFYFSIIHIFSVSSELAIALISADFLRLWIFSAEGRWFSSETVLSFCTCKWYHWYDIT